MIQFKLIFRKLWREKFFTFLKVIGLAIGIASCLIIFKIANYEFSFDKAHPGKEDIYQVVVWNHYEESTHGFGGVQSALGGFVEETFPEIEQIVPLNKANFPFVNVVRENEQVYRKEDPDGIYKTSPDYFEMLPYQWLVGDKSSALAQPYQVVLTKSRAEEYFGSLTPEEILGKTIQYENTGFVVSGVIADLDFPSTFDGKEFVGILEAEKANSNWFSFNSNNRLFLKLNVNQKERLLSTLDEKYDSMLPESWKRPGVYSEYSLLPLSEIHFDQAFGGSGYKANKKMVYGLIGIGAFILLLASINYINLSTAQIPYRMKEIGVRKTLGETNKRLTFGFLAETFWISLIAILFAFPLSKGFELLYPDFMPPRIENYSFLLTTSVFVLGVLLTLIFLTGLYPAFLINKVNVSESLKNQGVGKMSFGNLTFKKSMIIFQFVIAQIFVIGAFVISSQINFMIDSDLGFNKDAIVTMEIPTKEYQNAEVDPFLLKQALSKYPEIRQVALGHIPMSNMYWGNTLVTQSDTSKVELNMNFKYVDVDYMDLYGIKMKAGRGPQARDTIGSVFINETARIGLGFKSNEEAIGKTGILSSKPIIIEGVFNDFHQSNLHAVIQPLSIIVTDRKDILYSFSIKLPALASEWKNALSILEKEWIAKYPKAPFVYTFYDSKIEQLYESDMRQSRMINLATGLTIILGSLGLIGLVTLTAFQRTKEIGIRKVLGSSVLGIIVLLCKEYFKLVGIAILIAIPIAWWIMNKWLEDFAYRIEIKWWMFLLTGIATIVIALLAVGYHSIKAATANPIKSLKTE